MSKYEKFSRDELLALVQKQDGELASKKYGLVWDAEREPEQVVLDCAENFPVLKRVKGKEIRTNDGEDNILIEGDNYHALTVLNYTHKEKIDVIYIDPPYNTGNKDFKYNDRFVDKEDGFRHSKWLNFMEKRLNLAKDLLKPTGVIFISIDDNEQAQLKMLCDKVFGANNFVAVVTIQVNKGGRDYLPIAVTHEYLLCYFKSEKGILNELAKKVDFILKDSRGGYELRELRNRNPKFTKANRPNLYYPIYINSKSVDSEGKCLVSLIKSKEFHIEVFPLNSKGEDSCWRWGQPLTTENIAQNTNISNVVGKQRRDGGWNIYEKSRKATSKAKSIWDESEVRTEQGTIGLGELGMGVLFEHPKPVYLIKKVLQLATQSDAIILDFFAGSGTTGHSVMQLNKEDGGNRKFILCTNNENKICEEVTYPRIQKVIKGYKKNGDGEKVVGLGGNLQYFITALVRDTKDKKQTKMSLRGQCTEMLCVRENMFRLEMDADDYKIYTSNTGTSFLCVYYNLKKNSFKDFLKVVKKLKGKKKIYVFSLSGKIDEEIFDGIDDCEIEEIPEQIMNRYKELVRINIPLKTETIFLEVKKAQKKIFDDIEKDEGARILRIALEKTIKKIAQKNHINILKVGYKGEKTALLNDRLHDQKIFSKIQWEENKTCLAIGNNASHGEYDDYDMEDVENFYRHVQSLLHDFGI